MNKCLTIKIIMEYNNDFKIPVNKTSDIKHTMNKITFSSFKNLFNIFF